MAASSPMVLRAGTGHVHHFVGTRCGWRGGDRCSGGSRPQAALSLPRFSLVPAELFEVAEREHRVGVPVALADDLGVEQRAVRQVNIRERAPVLVCAFRVVLQSDLFTLRDGTCVGTRFRAVALIRSRGRFNYAA